MKKFLLCVLSLVTLILAAGHTPDGWETDIARAKRRAAAENKPILVLISGPEWCGPCQALEKNVINKPDFSRVARKNAVCLFIHSPKTPTPESRAREQVFKKVFKTGGVPRYALVDAKLNLINIPEGRTVYQFVKAISDARVKNGAEPVTGLKKMQREYEKEKRILEKKAKKSARKSKKSRKDK